MKSMTYKEFLEFEIARVRPLLDNVEVQLSSCPSWRPFKKARLRREQTDGLRYLLGIKKALRNLQ